MRDTTQRLSYIFGAIVLFFAFQVAPGQAKPAERAAPKLPFSTGPGDGQKIPAFSALDQHGKMQDFKSIRGPKGAMRS